MTTYSSGEWGYYNTEQAVFEDTKLTSSITPQNEHKTLPYQINLKWFKCKFCDTIFYDNFDKLIHTRQMHQAEEEEQQQLLNSATPSNSEKVIQDVPLQRINSEKFQKTSHKRKISQMETINVPPSPMNLTPPLSKIIRIFQNNESRSNNNVILQHQKIINCKFCNTPFFDNFEKLIHTMKEHQTTSSPNDSEKKLQKNTEQPEQFYEKHEKLIREKEKCKKIFASVMAKLRAKKCK